MPSLMDPVVRWADRSPEALALRDPAGDLDRRGLDLAARRFATVLRDRGVRSGQRVLLLAPACPEFVVAYLGLAAVGAVVVPVSAMSTEPEIRHVVQDSGARAVVARAGAGPAVAAAAAPDVPVHLLERGLWGPGVPGGEVLRQDAADTAAILYTSGTTGRPKGAQLTVGNLLAAAETSVEIAGSGPADRFGSALPLSHVFGQVAVMMSALVAGASLSLLDVFTPAAMLARIRGEGLTVIAGVPTMWDAMLALDEGEDGPGLTSVRLAISAGAPLPGSVADRFQERFGCDLVEGYGLTEATSAVTFSRGGGRGTVGRPVPGTRVELRDAGGRPVAPAAVGEIVVRGPTVMEGYWRRPHETAAVLDADGWLRTGDLGRFDADGRLRVVGRLKDLIIRGGYNVYPAEVEAVLLEHPDVVEAAVVGVPDDRYGEEVAAVVVLREGAVLAGCDVTAWSRTRLSAYKVPRLVGLVASLPRGPTGKILKHALDTSGLHRV